MESLLSVPQDTQPLLCIGSRRRQRRAWFGSALIPLATPWPVLPSNIAWSCWMWADSTRAPTHVLPPMLLARHSALPACTSPAVSEGSGGRQVYVYGRCTRARKCTEPGASCLYWDKTSLPLFIPPQYQDTPRACQVLGVQGSLVWGFRVSWAQCSCLLCIAGSRVG